MQVGRILWRRAWQPTAVFVPEECYGQRGLCATVHEVAKSRIRLKRLSTNQHDSLSSSHPLLPLLCPQVRSPRLHLYCRRTFLSLA